ncbi:uroporphyrinogen-III synthase [Synechococcus sp. CBW1006]|nr:uroporphyrinogen-III synthase [Synechococcus sp. CBW1006]
MIVRDEAACLERCLASVRDFVDEMVVVDTGSTDDTVAIAERCGAVVHPITWPGDFAPARNRALEWVRGAWVLVLDADEVLLPEAIPALRQLMEQPDLLLINLLRREQGASQSPYSSVSRLFRRHPAIHWSQAYHSLVDDSVMALMAQEPHWRIADCPEPALLHDGYRPELLADGRKAQRLRQAMEQELRRKPGDPYACAKLGALEVSDGNTARGLSLLKQGLAQCPAEAVAERYELLLHLAIATAPSQPQRATTLYREALTQPLPARVRLAAFHNLAALLLQQAENAGPSATPSHLSEALELARAATGAAPELAPGWIQLGLIERRCGHLEAAAAAYRRAITCDSSQAGAHQNLGVVSLLMGDIPAAREGFRQAIALLTSQGKTSAAEALRQQASSLVKLEPASPLTGRTVAVTRAEQQLGEARALFEAMGARVVDLPALVIGPPDEWGPLDDALAELEHFHWLILSSANGVEAVQQRLRRRGGDLAHLPGSLNIAAVGRKTARQLEDLGAPADFVPPAYVADSLIEHFPVSAWGLRLLLPRVQSGGRTVLAEAFGEAGARVVEVAAYETRCPEALPSQTLLALERGDLDAITFSSGKTVSHTCQLLQRHFGSDWRQRLDSVAVISIGPQTTARCRQELGRVDAEADPHDLNGLVAACCRALSEQD